MLNIPSSSPLLNNFKAPEKKPLFVQATDAIKSFGKTTADTFNNTFVPIADKQDFDRLDASYAKNAGVLSTDTPIEAGQKKGMYLGGAFAGQAMSKVSKPLFSASDGLTTKVLSQLSGKLSVSKQFIADLLKQQGVTKPEIELIQSHLAGAPDKIHAPDFVKMVQGDLLPLNRKHVDVSGTEFESINGGGPHEFTVLPKELRGSVSNYSEHVYESPIKTSADSVHFEGSTDSYYGHSRVEDLTDDSTRRVIEVQSDLFQKGRLEKEMQTDSLKNFDREFVEKGALENPNSYFAKDLAKVKELSKLKPYENTFHQRIIREEIKQAAKDGKSKIQFPTGETAMKVEGLDRRDTWRLNTGWNSEYGVATSWRDLSKNDLEIGANIQLANFQGNGGNFVITQNLSDGKFKAISRDQFAELPKTIQDKILKGETEFHSEWRKMIDIASEQFDISGKLDTNSPIYKFYEDDIGKFLKNKFGAELITDPQGVTWWEIPVHPTEANKPVQAYGKVNLKTLLPLAGAATAGKALFTPNQSSYSQELSEPTAQTTPRVTKTVQDLHGKYNVLDNGATVRDVPSSLQSAVQEAYKIAPTVDKGVIETLLMQESSMGTSTTNKNLSIGRYAYLVGMTKIAKKELIRNGIHADLDTKEGAIKAAAQYWALQEEKGKTPAQIYSEWYSNGSDEAAEAFDKIYGYYQGK